jgi:glycosyltransferase involved in cell wall biosynthesis
VPVVAFNVGGVADVVVDGETGLLIDTISSVGLLAAANRLIADPDLRMRLGRNGRKRVELHFTLSRQASAWVECLKRLC